ncbi:MAG: NAD(P)/FAD-dependent oxidoreductase [Candidatus Margulisiibacteriota bacterium]
MVVSHKIVAVRTIVVGAGLVGLSAAHATRGNVVVLDASGPDATEIRASVGDTRLVRPQEQPYLEALRLQSIQKMQRVGDFIEWAPVVIIGKTRSAIFKEEASYTASGLPELSSQTLSTRSPYLKLPLGYRAFCDPNGGILCLSNLMSTLRERIQKLPNSSIQFNQKVVRYERDREGQFVVTTDRGNQFRSDRLIFCKGPWAIEDGKKIMGSSLGRHYPFFVQRLDLFYFNPTDTSSGRPVSLPPMLMRFEMTQEELTMIAKGRSIPPDIESVSHKNGKISVAMYSMMEGGLYKVGYRITGARTSVDPDRVDQNVHPLRRTIVESLLFRVFNNVSLGYVKTTCGIVTVRDGRFPNDPDVPEVAMHRDREGAIHFLSCGGISAKLSMALGEVLASCSRGAEIPKALNLTFLPSKL